MAVVLRFVLLSLAAWSFRAARIKRQGNRKFEINMILEPEDKSGTPAGFVFLPGASVWNTRYEPMMKQMQKRAAESGVSLYVGVPWYFLDIPQPVDVKQRCEAIVKEFKKKGAPENAPIFYGGHSLGSVFIQTYVAELGDKARGQILMGGGLRRDNMMDYNVPTLSLNAELDGLWRITRAAESFYHQPKHLPVVALMGQNHHQFASGPPPRNVRDNDLEADVSEAVAHDEIAKVSSDFIASSMGKSNGSVLKSAVEKSATFFAPIVAAYELEGSRFFNMPAQFGGPQESRCVKGKCPKGDDRSDWRIGTSHSPWALEGQKTNSDIGVPLALTNQFVMAAGSPATGQSFHLPNVTNVNGILHIPTYSECHWNSGLDDLMDSFDTGASPTSAREIATKLLSRQCTMNVGLGKDVDFSVDDPNFCQITNEKAYQWALDNALPQTRERYERKGIKMTFGPDIEKGAGPLWLFDRLRFDRKGDVTEVRSPTQKTQQNYWKDTFGPIPKPPGVPDPGCYHYCKLLSPGRVMEYLLIDSLRK